MPSREETSPSEAQWEEFMREVNGHTRWYLRAHFDQDHRNAMISIFHRPNGTLASVVRAAPLDTEYNWFAIEMENTG